MTPKGLLLKAIDPALALLEETAGIKADQKARVMVTAIAGQESAWEHRRQINGPARSFWQFEKSGGVAGVFRVCPRKLEPVCAELHVPFNVDDVFEAMAWNDVLGAAMARLLLWTDPAPLPEPVPASVDVAWKYYLRTWRPGIPHERVWPGRWGTALMVSR